VPFHQSRTDSDSPITFHSDAQTERKRELLMFDQIARFDPAVQETFSGLATMAEYLTDCERARIAMENRIRSIEQGKTFVLPHQAAVFEAALRSLKTIENRAIKDAEEMMSEHPLGEWASRPDMAGVGMKSLLRLLGSIGDPYVRYASYDVDGELLEPARPRRGPAELWAYCGMHVVDGRRPRMKRGEQANWKVEAKKRLYLVAWSCSKNKGCRYYEVKQRAKEAAAAKVHQHECRNSVRPVAGKPMGSNGCGTSAHPEWGAVGSPWRPGHQEAYALGIVGKAILKDLFNESKRLHQESLGLS
jgi:hypothetical protein